MSGPLIFGLIGALIAAVCGVSDLAQFQRLAFLDASSWKRRRAVGVVLGAALGAAAAIWAGHQQDVAEVARKRAEIERDRQLSEVSRLNRQIADDQLPKVIEAGRLTVAQQQRILKVFHERFPGDPPDSAIERLTVALQARVTAVEKLTTRRDYRPLSASTRSQVLRSLTSVAPDLQNRNVTIGVNWFNDSTGALGKAAAELRGLLEESGIAVSAFAPVAEVGGPNRRPVLLCNQANADVCQRVSHALGGMILLPVGVSANWNSSQIGVMLSGTPTFSDVGAITLE